MILVPTLYAQLIAFVANLMSNANAHDVSAHNERHTGNHREPQISRPDYYAPAQGSPVYLPAVSR